MPKNNNQKQKNTTIDELAVMVAHGFEETKRTLKKDFKKELKGIKKELSKMVTKDHFDDTIADLRGNSVLRDRKIDAKVNLITKGLKKKKVIDKNIITSVENIVIFPQSAKEK